MITITDRAKEKIKELSESDERDGLALRVAITGRGFGSFMYRLQLVEEKEKHPDDVVVDLGDFKAFIDMESAPNLKNASLDYSEGPPRAGFRFDNPNPLWTDPLAERVQKVIDEKINPGLMGHGGFISLVAVKDGVAQVRLGGGCQGCAGAKTTMSDGVEAQIKAEVPEIEAVVDITDHASGANPYQ